MNKTFLLGGLAATAMAVAGIAAAQTAPAPQTTHHVRGDVDGDGRISQAEFVDGRIARLTAQDMNRDGSVSREERQAAMQARRTERADARFTRLDADGNGAISRAEFDAGHAAHPDRGSRAERAGHRGPRRAGGARERGPVVIAETREKLAASFARMDADEDGFVTADERRASMRRHRQARRERMSQPRAAAPAPAPAAVPAPTSE